MFDGRLCFGVSEWFRFAVGSRFVLFLLSCISSGLSVCSRKIFVLDQ